MKNCVAHRRAVAVAPVAGNQQSPIANQQSIHSLAFKAGPMSLLLAIVPILIPLFVFPAAAGDYDIQLHEVNLSLYAPPPSTICLDSATEIVADCIAVPYVTDEDGQQLPLGEDGTWYIAAVCTWDWDTNDANDEKANPTPLGSPPDNGAECHWLIGYDEPGVYAIRVACTAELRQVGTNAVLADDGPVTSNTVDLTIVEADLDAAGVDDADEETPGAYMGMNEDDDDGDEVPDGEDPLVPGEDNLLAITLQKVQPASALASDDVVRITWEGSLELYGGSDKSNPVIQEQEYPLSALPKTLYVEAKGGGGMSVTMEYLRELETGDFIGCTDSININVCTLEYIKVKRKGSTEDWSDTTTIAAGGFGSDVHKALVEMKITPVPAGAYSVACPVSLEGAEGYGGRPPDCPANNVKAKLLMNGAPTVEGNGVGDVVFSSPDGIATGELVSGNVALPCTIASACSDPALPATVEFSWDERPKEDMEWEYDPYFDYGLPAQPVSLTIKLAGTVPIDGHHLDFYVCAVAGLMWNDELGRYDTFYEKLPANLDPYSQFHEDENGTGSGVVPEDPQGSGKYTAYQLVKVDPSWNFIVDTVWFWVADIDVYHNHGSQ